VTIDKNLSWSEHIKQITKKANNVKSFLQRNISKCPARIKSNSYKTPVKPILEYASTVWSPYTQRNINAIKNVQRRAARFVNNNYSRYASVSEMLTNLNWPTLSRGRNEQKATMLFKIISHQIDINADHLLIPNPDIHHTRSHSKRFLIPMTCVDSYKYSFFPSAIKIWNSLPQHVINSTDTEQFKYSLAGLETV